MSGRKKQIVQRKRVNKIGARITMATTYAGETVYGWLVYSLDSKNPLARSSEPFSSIRKAHNDLNRTCVIMSDAVPPVMETAFMEETRNDQI